MILRELKWYRIEIPFRESFRHSSAERSATQSVWVEALGEDTAGVGEGCPRKYVTGEGIASAQCFFAQHHSDLCARVGSLDSLRAWAEENRSAIDANPAAWCAIELAILEMLARHESGPVEKLLSLPPLTGQFRYSAVLGDSAPDVFRKTAARYHAMGFHDFKCKLSGDLELDKNKISALLELKIPGLRIRVDANNLWRTAGEAADHIRMLDYPFAGIEEPVGAGRFEDMRDVSARTQCRIILDESFLRADQMDLLADDPQRWMVNIRVSKMGGLMRSLAAVERARRHAIPIIIGAQVGETSVLTRAALPVAQAAGETLFAQEGAFGTLLLERDVCDPPLMFGRGGILDADAMRLVEKPGWGLECLTPLPQLIQKVKH